MVQDSSAGICVKNISAGYRGKDVIKDVSLFFPAGKITVILGENGSGKTTLLKAMAGLISYRGSITVDGRELSRMSARERAACIAVLSQMNSAYFSYTVEETVRMGRYRFHSGIFTGITADDRMAVEKCLADQDLLSIRDSRIGEISGGQLQRVYLASMFAQDPRYVFLDEPTNHLDLKYRMALENNLKQTHSSVIAVYHDIRDALKVAHQIVLLKDGRVVDTGSPSEIREKDSLNKAFSMDVSGYLAI